MATSLICDSTIIYGKVAGGVNGLNLIFPDGSTALSVVPYCPTGWLQVAHVPPFESSQIDPQVVAALFGAGFLLYLTPWATAYGFSALLKLLR